MTDACMDLDFVVGREDRLGLKLVGVSEDRAECEILQVAADLRATHSK